MSKTDAQKIEAFDLSVLDEGVELTEQGSFIELKHPASGKPLGIEVAVVYGQSEAWQEKLRKLKKDDPNLENAESIEYAKRLAQECVVGWRTKRMMAMWI